MEKTIQYLKEQLYVKGEQWRNTRDEEDVKDCLALIEAINALEERKYGKYITDITFILNTH